MRCVTLPLLAWCSVGQGFESEIHLLIIPADMEWLAHFVF
jgi:hypothetical protein